LIKNLKILTQLSQTQILRHFFKKIKVGQSKKLSKLFIDNFTYEKISKVIILDCIIFLNEDSFINYLNENSFLNQIYNEICNSENSFEFIQSAINCICVISPVY
jgi:hypothetical protein